MQDLHHPKFYDNHIHLLQTCVHNGNNSIVFNVTINLSDTKENRLKIKIKQGLLEKALSLNKYCKENSIKGYDKLRMFIFLLKMLNKDSISNFVVPSYNSNITYSTSENTTLYSQNSGEQLPFFTDEDIKKCIEVLETYAIICTALKIINKTMIGMLLVNWNNCSNRQNEFKSIFNIFIKLQTIKK